MMNDYQNAQSLSPTLSHEERERMALIRSRELTKG